MVARVPAKGELAQALTQNPEMYTLLSGPSDRPDASSLCLPETASGAGRGGLRPCRNWLVDVPEERGSRRLSAGAAMIVFFAAAHIAMMRFDNYLGSYPLAQKLEQSPPGQLIECDAYYAFSSVFFYTNRPALLLNGRYVNLEYGSNAPDAPKVFIDDAGFAERWKSTNRYYLLAYGDDLP